MYYINKIVGFLVSPIGGAIAGGLLSVVCARLGRERLAKWTGGLTVVWQWCDVLVLPMLSENFGLVIADALEHGKRVITGERRRNVRPVCEAARRRFPQSE